MSSFDDWYNENSWNIENYYDAEISFKAGAQSRQSEVDELKKRIDDALKEFEENNDPWSMIVDEVIKILKGENHES